VNSDESLGDRPRMIADLSGLYWSVGKKDKAMELAKSIANSEEKLPILKLFDCAK
jgi:hypothetical protein